jgi:hypothetical protein
LHVWLLLLLPLLLGRLRQHTAAATLPALAAAIKSQLLPAWRLRRCIGNSPVSADVHAAAASTAAPAAACTAVLAAQHLLLHACNGVHEHVRCRAARHGVVLCG